MPDAHESALQVSGTGPSVDLSARKLVVLTPGVSGSYETWRPLKERIMQEPGFGPTEALWLDFVHNTKLWSTGTLEEVAENLRARIDATWNQQGGFDEILLVGHSMGGLIVRQAYLLAAGAVPGQPESSWSERVSRIVLFASLNRGIDPWKMPLWGFFAWLARAIPFLPPFRGMDAIRGSHFLTNLRINWIRHFMTLSQEQRAGRSWRDGRPKRAPLVVQLLGQRDSLVDPDDSRDVLVFPSGHEERVADANHRNLFRLDLAPDPDLRYAVLREGFIGRYVDDPPAESAINRVVFLLHGIRASNVDDWIEGLRQRIAERDPTHTIILKPTYGYFTAARFALPGVRRKNIAMFQDWYTEALAKHPTAEFNIIAHSNGTYILGRSLKKTPGMRFKNVTLAGSVLPMRFSWDDLIANGQVGRVRNDRANRDWPVALLCNALCGLQMRDVGTAGFAGFKGQETYECAYYPGGHSKALDPEYQDYLVNFVFGGEPRSPEGLSPSEGYFRQLSNLMYYLGPLLVVCLLLCLGWFVFAGGAFHAGRAIWTAIGLFLLYIILDIM